MLSGLGRGKLKQTNPVRGETASCVRTFAKGCYPAPEDDSVHPECQALPLNPFINVGVSWLHFYSYIITKPKRVLCIKNVRERRGKERKQAHRPELVVSTHTSIKHAVKYFLRCI